MDNIFINICKHTFSEINRKWKVTKILKINLGFALNKLFNIFKKNNNYIFKPHCKNNFFKINIY